MPCKTVPAALTKKLCVKLQWRLASLGLEVKLADSGRDLGVVTRAGRNCGGLRHRTKTTKKAKARTRIAKAFRRWTNAGPNILRVGATAPLTYGDQARQMSDTELWSHRAIGVEATGVIGAGRCATAALSLGLGCANGPGVVVNVNRFREWIRAWRHHPELRDHPPKA